MHTFKIVVGRADALINGLHARRQRFQCSDINSAVIENLAVATLARKVTEQGEHVVGAASDVLNCASQTFPVIYRSVDARDLAQHGHVEAVRRIDDVGGCCLGVLQVAFGTFIFTRPNLAGYALKAGLITASSHAKGGQ